MKKAFYRCPSCGKRRLDVEYGPDMKSDRIFCSSCGFDKVVSRDQFVTEIHGRDPQIQRTRKAVMADLEHKGIRVIAERSRPRRPR